MRRLLLLLLLPLLLGALLQLVASHEPFRVIFEWKTVNVSWPSEELRVHSINHKWYIPANHPVAGIKLWKGKMYLTFPRWKEGVPFTLGVTSATPIKNITDPKVEAYPNWDMQKVGDCRAFQFVQSMEIDPKGRMWVLDTGRTETLTLAAKSRCPPRLVILDLEDEGKVLRSYNFPSTVTPPESSYLNDIVLDHEDGGLAYISDNGKDDPGIIVYSLRNNTSWKVRHESMKAKPEAVSFMVKSTRIVSPINVDGIALSPASAKNRTLYYSPLSSFNLFSLPVSVLKDSELSKNVDSYVRDLGRKISQTDGMAMSAKGVLYFGLLADDAVAMWDSLSSPSFNNGQRTISRDHFLMQWPDTFAFDEDGNIWCISNSLQNFLTNQVNPNVTNYRAIRSKAMSKSYQYLEDGSSPILPDIEAGADARMSSFALASSLALLLLFIAK
ncbi:dopaminechrome tautomerase-like [Prorops nasuta]|uniref:dopaminechrome tautomerase-like n=1 Tax=Prorops nasuta TaxID=863751 RepID=UPI0034CDCAB4